MKYDIKAIENLVDEMGDCYDYPDEEQVSKMNQLIGQDWDGETYWQYTCEYWSHHSLEQTVYALIHGGEYPPEKKYRYFVWNAQSELLDIMKGAVAANATEAEILEETHLFFRLGRYYDNRERFALFNELPMDEIYQWLKESFATWECEEDEEDDDDEDRVTLSFNLDVEYGIERNILVFPYEEKCISITFTNVEEEDIKKVLDYLEQFVTDCYKVVE